MVNGRARVVQILEVDSPLLSYDRTGVRWPPHLPPLHGAMLCYDATNPKALSGLRQLLGGFWTRGGVKIIGLACKSQPKDQPNTVDPMEAVAVCQQYSAGLVPLDGGIEDPEQKQKSSFKWICRNIIEARGELSATDATAQRLKKSRSKVDVQTPVAESPTTPSSVDTPTTPLHPIARDAMTIASQPGSIELAEPSPTSPTSFPQRDPNVAPDSQLLQVSKPPEKTRPTILESKSDGPKVEQPTIKMQKL